MSSSSSAAAAALRRRGLAISQPRLAGTVEVAAVAALALIVADTVWMLAAPGDGAGGGGPAMAARGGPAPAVEATLDTTILTAFDPFHTAPAPGDDAVPAAVAADAGAVESDLDLTLTGVRLGPDGGSAIIAKRTGDQGRYGPGDTVLDGVRVERILPYRVVLARGGRLESLYLVDRAVRDRRGRPAAEAAPAGAPLADAPAGEPAPQPRPGATPEPGSAGPAVADARAAELTAKRLMAAVQFRPRLADGRLTGYVVMPRGEAALFRYAGFVPGDVVVALNGRSVGEIRDPAALDATLRAAERAVFAVERDGARTRVTIDLDG
ncbi:type II secretion system protein N [Rhodothalassium salexigens]|uniref:type II secretion system protein N n=1 Tax=Rhodothalassium salexigens TaxID=1086 RepID=UPI00104D2071|nr:type II secretion system protein N [Rhodothalassium salexigens]MBB4210221.1 general secretion pathway protein C [Rhodothalassium salexigens DSM 2132]MBK1638662.1 hypothetical protein [Rhodothalassium salexigens DSM 2132]